MEGFINLYIIFAITQGTLPWQLVKIKKSAFFADQSSLSRCHSKIDCNIASTISKDYMASISLHRKEFW